MKCPKCEHTLAVVRTQRGRETESRDLICYKCSFRATSLAFLILRDEKKPRGTTSRSLLPLAEDGAFDAIKESLHEMVRRGMIPDA